MGVADRLRGHEGGLDQASRGYQHDSREHFDIDGRPAIYTPAGEVEWLLQARKNDGIFPSDGRDDITGQYVVDPCLKLSDGSRACARGMTGSATGDIVRMNSRATPLVGGGELPPFLIVMTRLPAATMRVPTADGHIDAALVELSGGQRRGATVVTDAELRLAGPCGVKLLDARDVVDACLVHLDAQLLEHHGRRVHGHDPSAHRGDCQRELALCGVVECVGALAGWQWP